MHFSRHYTLAEAQALLPKVRQWLEDLERQRTRILKIDQHIAPIIQRGDDAGGQFVNDVVAEVAAAQETLNQFRSRQIQIKDIERGLVDFPSIREGREVFLCWEKDEDDIEFWHELETGYSGRERL